MDERFRKLERLFLSGQASPAESQRLREYYTTYFDHCPASYVMQEISNKIHDFSAWDYQHHLESHENLTKVFSGLGPDVQKLPEVAALLTNSKSYQLALSSTMEESNIFPLLKMRTIIRSRANSIEWIDRARRAAEHIRNIYAAILSQCGYYECTEVIPPRPLAQNLDSTGFRIIGVSCPQNRLRHNTDLTVWPDLGVQYRSQYHEDLISIKAIIPLSIDDLKTHRQYIRVADETEVIPGSLRVWLADHNLDSGYLVLAGVTDRVFRLHSEDAYRANHHLNSVLESEITDPPEMIYFIPQQGDIWIVPTATEYFKTCTFLRLLAEV